MLKRIQMIDSITILKTDYIDENDASVLTNAETYSDAKIASMNTNEIIQLINFQAPSEEYHDNILENNLIIDTNDITFKSYTSVDFDTGNATFNEF